MTRRKTPTITGSDKNAKRPSAITIAGRSAGMVSGQSSSATDAATEWACSLVGITWSRNAMTRGRSTLYQPTVARWADPEQARVDPGAEVDDDGVGMLGRERPHSVVEHLGAQRRLAHHARRHAERGEVVIDLGDDVGGEGVAEDGPGPSAVECSGVLGEQRGLLERGEVADVDARVGSGSHDRKRTRALTRRRRGIGAVFRAP